MRFTYRSALRYVSIFSFSCLILALVGHNTRAQTPRVLPTARLLSLPVDVTSASRPRRVFAPTTVTGSPSRNEATDVEKRAFDSTNTVRVENGLAPLVWDPALCRMARIHSESMVQRGYFAHQTPEGERLKDRARAVGIAHFRVLGENIAYNQGYDDPGAFAVQRWMISPGHRANILSNEFEQSGIGVFVAPDGTVYLTQVFMKR
jgi:uncharacterized protein YkwD